MNFFWIISFIPMIYSYTKNETVDLKIEAIAHTWLYAKDGYVEKEKYSTKIYDKIPVLMIPGLGNRKKKIENLKGELIMVPKLQKKLKWDFIQEKIKERKKECAMAERVQLGARDQVFFMSVHGIKKKENTKRLNIILGGNNNSLMNQQKKETEIVKTRSIKTPVNPVILMTEISKNIKIENQIMNADGVNGVVGLLLITKALDHENKSPLSRIRNRSKIPVYFLNSSLGSLLFQFNNWNIGQYQINKNSIMFLWLKGTVSPREKKDKNKGFIEISLVMMILFLCLAFITSLILHYYLYDSVWSGQNSFLLGDQEETNIPNQLEKNGLNKKLIGKE